jgi:diadenosine tetraphosphatase ApaH/serine/threonine PP2A family protein phosphatase
MLSKAGNRSCNRLLRHALIAVGCFGSLVAVSAQSPLPPSVPASAPKPANVSVPVSTGSPSQVFPDLSILNAPTSPPASVPVVTLSTAQGQGGGVSPGPYPSADYAQPGIPRDGQTVPGLDYYRYKDEYLPFYYYQPNYYERADVGARPFADYAPPGFEAREFQDAPGAPEFTRLSVPPQITEEERQKFVTRGMMPGSFLVPGTNTSFRIRGFVRGTAIYDFQPIGSRDDFVTNTIPVPQENGENFNYDCSTQPLCD